MKNDDDEFNEFERHDTFLSDWAFDIQSTLQSNLVPTESTNFEIDYENKNE